MTTAADRREAGGGAAADGAGGGYRLLVLFNYGATLSLWRRIGHADRELNYYRALQRAGAGDVTLLTYDDAPAEHADYARPLRVLGKRGVRGNRLFSVLAPLVCRQAFREADVWKTNQAHGAWLGAVAKLLYRRKTFVIRCGYVRTPALLGGEEGLGIWGARFARAAEWLAFRVADAAIVTTAADGDFLVRRYGVRRDKLAVIPNCVDTERFRPAEASCPAGPLRVIMVGRLVPLKNFGPAIEALARLAPAVRGTLIGQGHLQAELEALAQARGLPLEIVPAVPNDRLPERLRAADVLLLPQTYGAGMSKAMIEAMACGLLVVASDIEPHRQVIEDGVNGFLCGTAADALAACLARVLALPPSARAAVARQAREDAVTRYSMRVVTGQEVALCRKLLARRGQAPRPAG